LAKRHWDFLTGDREKDQRNVEVLLESVEEMYARRSVDDRIRSAVDRAILVTGAEEGVLLLPDENGELQPYVTRDRDGGELPLDTPYSTTVVKRVWESGRPFVTVDVADSSGMGDLGESISFMRLLSVMGVPMPVEGQSIGVLYVHSTKAVRSFGDSDLSVLQALGSLMGHAVERARLRAEEEDRERMMRDLKVAQRIQEGFLPEELPQPAGFDIAGVGKPCEETSGDYYDVVPYGNGRYALIVGDVSDHGLGPALVMASTRALLHGILASADDPIEVIGSVNRFLERDTPDEAFMTMVLGSLDPKTREFSYVSAGHNCPYLLEPGGELEELPRTGLALGILPNVTYKSSEVRTLKPGTIVMFYTDGIFEARGHDGELYGEDRLRESFLRHASTADSAQAIMDGALGDLKTFVDGRRLDDDVTCLVLRAV